MAESTEQCPSPTATNPYEQQFRELIQQPRAAGYTLGSVIEFVRRLIAVKMDDLRGMPRLKNSYFRVNLGVVLALALFFAFYWRRIPGPSLWTALLVHAAYFGFFWPLCWLNLHRMQNPPPDFPEGHDHFRLANTITYVRLQAIPLLVVGLGDSGFAAMGVEFLVIYGVMATSDFLDGFLSRRLHQESYFGKMLDPFVDIVFHIAVASALWVSAMIPWWFAILVIARYLTPLVSSFVHLIWRGGYRVEPTLIGKVGANLVGLALGMGILKQTLRPEWLSIEVFVGYLAFTALFLTANIGYIVYFGLQLVKDRQGYLDRLDDSQ